MEWRFLKMAVTQVPQLLVLFFMILFPNLSTCLLDLFLFCYISVLKWGLQLDLANIPKAWLPLTESKAFWASRQSIHGGGRVKAFGFLKYQFCALNIKIIIRGIVHLLPFNQCLLLICLQHSGLELIT